MLKCYSFGKSLTFKAKITSVSLHPSYLKSLCVHCEMGDFKHLWRKIITAPLHLTGCVQQLLPYKLWATRSFAKWAESFERPMGASDMTDVYLESFPQHQDHIFKALCGIQQLGCAHWWWQWSSLGLHEPKLLLPWLLHGDGHRKLQKGNEKSFYIFQMCKWICIFYRKSTEILQCQLLHSRVTQLVLHQSLCLWLKDNWL